MRKFIYSNIPKIGWIVRIKEAHLHHRCEGGVHEGLAYFRAAEKFHDLKIEFTDETRLAAQKGRIDSVDEQERRNMVFPSGRRVWLDEADFEAIKDQEWFYRAGSAWRVRYDPANHSFLEERMENVILQTEEEVFHPNGNGLDNRRVNLSLDPPPVPTADSATRSPTLPDTPLVDLKMPPHTDPHGPGNPEHDFPMF